MNFTIDQFREQDIASLAKLWKMLFRNFPVSTQSIKKYTFGYTDFDSTGCFTARVNNQLVGFVFATIMQIPETDYSKLLGCVPVIMVHQEYQKKGIGKRLLKKAVTYLGTKNVRKIVPGYPTYIRSTILSFMGVNSQWKQALWFFRHYGFNVTSVLDSAKVSLGNFTIPKYIIENEKKAAEQEIKTTTLTKQNQNRFLDFLKTAFTPW
jgi:GNAT superfamily N-acetyltransferase